MRKMSVHVLRLRKPRPCVIVGLQEDGDGVDYNDRHDEVVVEKKSAEVGHAIFLFFKRKTSRL